MALFKEAIPGLSRIAALWHADADGKRTTEGLVKETEIAAQALRWQIHLVGANDPNMAVLDASRRNDRASALSSTLRGRRRDKPPGRSRSVLGQYDLPHPWDQSAMDIGTSVSSGCIRLTNEDVMDLYRRVKVGTRVVVLPGRPPVGTHSRRS